MEAVQHFGTKDKSLSPSGRDLLFKYYYDVEGHVQLTLRRGSCRYGREFLMSLESLEGLRREFPGEVSYTLLNPASEENVLFIGKEVPMEAVIGKYMSPMDTTYSEKTMSMARFMNSKKGNDIIHKMLLDACSVVQSI